MGDVINIGTQYTAKDKDIVVADLVENLNTIIIDTINEHSKTTPLTLVDVLGALEYLKQSHSVIHNNMKK